MVDYNGTEIRWNDAEEKFEAEFKGKTLKHRNINEIKKIIARASLTSSRGFILDNWHRTNSITEVEITSKKGSTFMCRPKGVTYRSKSEYNVYADNEYNRSVIKEIETCIKEQIKIQDSIVSKTKMLQTLIA